MTRTVGSYEAKTHFAQLLAEVESGVEIVITKHGRPVARMVSAEAPRPNRVELMEQMRKFRESVDPVGIPFRELIDEGRKH
jgi:prevent-host-death family protein